MLQSFNELIAGWETNIWSAIGGIGIVCVILFLIYYWFEEKGWVAKVVGTKEGSLRQAVANFTKFIEFFAVLVAVIAVLVEFQVERPRERALRKAQLLLQLTNLASYKDEKLKNAKSAILNTIELLAKEGVAMTGMVFPTGLDLQRANLRGAKLHMASLKAVTLNAADLSRADLSRADLSCMEDLCAGLIFANLTYGHLE